MPETPPHDLVIVGASPPAVALAAQARRAGLADVIMVADGAQTVPTAALETYALTVRFGTVVDRVGPGNPDGVEIQAGGELLQARACALVGRPSAIPTVEIPCAPSVADRCHHRVDFDGRDLDVLVTGGGEIGAEQAIALVEAGARVVLCFTTASTELSPVTRRTLAELEHESRITVLWQSAPDSIEDVGGFPMAYFPDRRTPDLQFDHVVMETKAEIPATIALTPAPGIYAVGVGAAPGIPAVSSHQAWSRIRAEIFPSLPDLVAPPPSDEDGDRLSSQHYNATISHFDTAHNELWRLRVRPDNGEVAYRAGQYVTLGVGYWEPRADDAREELNERRRQALIRRSYSISSRIFDPVGYLADHKAEEDVELYVVWVQADGDRLPGLTPRLALKGVGDRVYLGPKIAGRYTLDPVTDPAAPVVFLATGTGEAPHNAMTVELLRKGHHGPILSAVSVRYRSDLAYLDEHRALEERHPNYRYLAMPTREPDTPKRYLQDLYEDGTLAEAMGGSLDQSAAQVFLCGNPAMIGLPTWEEGTPSFPEVRGMSEILHAAGFDLDRRGHSGNVHHEEYW